MRSSFCLLFVLWVGACGDSNDLPDATLTNVERTETLYSLVGTPVATPSGYSLDGGRPIRTDQTDAFDFAYNIQPDGSHVFIPRAGFGIDTTNTANPGFQRRTESFEAITSAPSDGYVSDTLTPIAVGERYVVRGRITCLSLGVPKYAKLEVLSFDETAKTVNFRILIDDNCGFKGLEPGLPKN
jgi:hypothetical protein